MTASETDTFGELLARWRGGDEAAGRAVVERLYTELRRAAASLMRRERADHTLQPTAIVHEAYVRLFQSPLAVDAAGAPAEIVPLFCKKMREVLVDAARRRRAGKRGGGRLRVELTDDAATVHPRRVDFLDLDRALGELATIDPTGADLVELRYFGGLTLSQAASALGISTTKAKRLWSFRRAWLFDRLTGAADGAAHPE